jgi:hypothetical protein
LLELTYELDPDYMIPGGPYPDLWVDALEMSCFNGYQTIVVNGHDFSNSLPILGFARTLRIIATALSDGDMEQEYSDLTSQWRLAFKRDGDFVTILDHRGEARVLLAEFKEISFDYAFRVYAAMCEKCPELLENEFVTAWWENDDFYSTPFEPSKTDRSTLTPVNPFYRPLTNE